MYPKEVAKVWKLNSCPRCGRGVFRYQNVNGIWYERCFRCGYHAKLGIMTRVEDTVSDNFRRQAEEGRLVSKHNSRRCSDDHDTLGTIQGNDELEECYGQAV